GRRSGVGGTHTWLRLKREGFCSKALGNLQGMGEGKTYIFRMTHFRNAAFIFQNGLHCCNCQPHDPDYISIGHRTLINQRGQSPLPLPPGGVLNDYIPFYFASKTPMLYQIYKGLVHDYAGTQTEIIYLVSTVETIVELNLPFLFTDRHAYLLHKIIYNNIEDLTKLDWSTIKDQSWHTHYSDVKKELKQAEFLVHRHLPLQGIRGIIVQNVEIATFVEQMLANAGLDIKVAVRADYYYP
ncbi:MAG: hypothetical protein DI539_27825, partial [Flavobacterium psychrophilum]